MTDLGNYSEKLPCGGTLNVRASDWDITYYFPGPDRRYNGKFVRIPGGKVDQYIDAWTNNWDEYLRIREALPATSGFYKTAQLGMVIHQSGFRSGVCLDGYHMCVGTPEQLAAVITSYRHAQSRIEDILAELYLRAGMTKPAPAVKRTAVYGLLNNAPLEVGHLPPAVQLELAGAMTEVRRAQAAGMPGSSYRVANWFGKENAAIFIEALRKHGIEAALEHATFYLKWKPAIGAQTCAAVSGHGRTSP